MSNLFESILDPQGAGKRGIANLKGMFDEVSKGDGLSLTKKALSGASRIFAPNVTRVADVAKSVGVAKEGLAEAAKQKAEFVTKAKKVGKAAAITAGMTVADAALESKQIDRQEASQMRLISQEYGIAEQDLAANANLRRAVQGSQEVDALIDQINGFNNLGPVQTQFFG